MVHLDPSLIAVYTAIARHMAGYGFSMVTIAKVAYVHHRLQRGHFPQTMVDQRIAALLRIRLKEKPEAMPNEIQFSQNDEAA